MELIPIVPLGTEYTLSDFECHTAIDAAHRRREVNIEAEMDMEPVDTNRHRNEGELDGVSAEIAFCHLFNVYADLVGEARRSEFDEGDCRLGPYRVDVKGRPEYGDNWLLVSKWKAKDRLYALMTGTHPTWTFRGFMQGKDLIARSPVEVSKGKPAMDKASESELFPWSVVVLEDVDDE